MTNWIFCMLIISAHITPTGYFAILIYGESISATNNTMQQHANHIIDNLIISQHISLTGNLVKGDYILLMDLTPFATSVEGHSHIAMKIPCNEAGSPKAVIVTGISPPDLKSLNVGKAINNGTLNGKKLRFIRLGKFLSLSCSVTNRYHRYLVLVNTSNETLNFDRGGDSVTVSVHGTAIQHLG